MPEVEDRTPIELRREAAALIDEADRILQTSKGYSLSRQEAEKADKLMQDAYVLRARADALEEASGYKGLVALHESAYQRDGDLLGYGNGQPSTERASATGYTLRSGETFVSRAGSYKGPDLGTILRGAANLGGREERDAVSGLTGANGEVVIPSYVSAQILDRAMEQSALVRAGASRVRMLARTHVVPRISSDPTLSWRAELGTVAEDKEPGIDAATLTAKSLSGVAVVSMEALEDASGLGNAVEASLARAVAKAIDAAALAESTGSNAPVALQLDNAINTGVRTWTPSAADLPVMWGELAAQSGMDMSWVIAPYADVATIMAEQASTAGSWLGLPPLLPDLRLIGSAALDADSANVLAGAGAGSIAIGSIGELRITVLRERYAVNQSYTSGTTTADIGGAVGFMVWWRGDVAAVDPQRLMLFGRGAG